MATSSAAADARPQFTRPYRSWFLFLLVAIYACSFIDRIIINIVGPAIIRELKLSDLQFGLLGGLSFAVFYALFGIPVARLAERHSRITIITVAVTIWSVMTALCGVAQNYWQLLLFRMGVGVGEGGCGPAAQSLISDHYPPRQRASALAIFTIGVPLGSMLGAVAGGWIAESFSWRFAFMMVGLPGLVLALLARLTLKEPVRGFTERTAVAATAPPLKAVLGRLFGSPTFVHVALGCVLTNMAANGINLFSPTFLARTFEMNLREVGLLYGLAIGASGTAGILLGGFATDAGGRRDMRWYGWGPAIGFVLACPAFLLAFTRGSAIESAACIFLGYMSLSIGFAPTFAVIQNLVEPRMRASAAALMLLMINICGQGIGPTAIGWASDMFAGRMFTMGDFAALCPGGRAAAGAAADLASACQVASAGGLRTALLSVCVLFLWGAGHYAWAARTIRRDMAGLGA